MSLIIEPLAKAFSLTILNFMIRKMGNAERAQTLVNEFSSMAAVGVLRLRRLPSPEIIQQALNQLQKRHPALQMRIAQQGGDFIFETVADCPPISVELVEDAGDEEWLSVVQTAVNQQIPNQAPLLRAVCLQLADTPHTTDLILIFHHGMMDAFSGVNLFEELLRLLSSDTSFEPTALPHLPPCETRFPPEMRGMGLAKGMARFMAAQMGDEMGYRWGMRGKRQQLMPTKVNCAPLVRKLSVAQTRALSRVTRQQGVTMNSVVATAQLLAVHKLLYKNEALPLRTMVFANLRPFLQPAVTSENLGCYITPTRQTVAVSSSPDFWQISQTIQNNVTTMMRRGEGFLNSLMSDRLIKMMVMMNSARFAATAVSYVGALNLQPHYGDIEVLDMHAFLANNRLGPEFTAFSHIFQRRLVYDFVYLEEDMDRETAVAIADETCEILRRVTEF